MLTKFAWQNLLEFAQYLVKFACNFAWQSSSSCLMNLIRVVHVMIEMIRYMYYVEIIFVRNIETL